MELSISASSPRGSAAWPLASPGRPACPPGSRQIAETSAARSPAPACPPLFVPLAKEPVEARNLAHEIIEALVGRSHLLERPDQQRTRPARPQKQRQMRQIPALDNGLGEVVHPGLRVIKKPAEGGLVMCDDLVAADFILPIADGLRRKPCRMSSV